MRRLVLFAIALALMFACGRGRESTSERGVPLETVGKQPAKAASPAANAGCFVAYVDNVKLYAEPSVNSEVLAVLTQGTKLENGGEVVAKNSSTLELWMFKEHKDEYCFMRKVTAGETSGWVTDRYVLPVRLYETFKEADVRGKQGDAAGMLAAVKRGNLAIGDDPKVMAFGDTYAASPNGERVFVTVNMPSDWRGDYPEDYYLPSLVLYFVKGQGLVDRLILYHHYYRKRKWSPDSRFFVCTFMTEEYATNLVLFDAVTYTFSVLKPTMTTAYEPPGVYVESPFEFVPGYVVWFGAQILTQPIPTARAPIERRPVLAAYELETGRVIRILEGDMVITSNEVYHEQFCDYYKVKMLPTDPCPPAVKDSELYQKFWEGYGYAGTGSGA